MYYFQCMWLRQKQQALVHDKYVQRSQGMVHKKCLDSIKCLRPPSGSSPVVMAPLLVPGQEGPRVTLLYCPRGPPCAAATAALSMRMCSMPGACVDCRCR